ncbi:MAG: hypothetical protein CK550_03565 [Gemmatimonadetes bacterium]|nr:MAG: hypothetical protein CK550_03565 [Gemmatimonadota bacterium]
MRGNTRGAISGRDIEKGAIQQFAGRRAIDTSLDGTGGGRLQRIENRQNGRGRPRHRNQRELHFREEGERALAAHQQIHQVSVGAQRLGDRIARRLLPHTRVRQRVGRDVAADLGADLRHRLGEPSHGRYADWPRRITPHPHVGAVVEHAPHAQHPRPRRAEL